MVDVRIIRKNFGAKDNFTFRFKENIKLNFFIRAHIFRKMGFFYSNKYCGLIGQHAKNLHICSVNPKNLNLSGQNVISYSLCFFLPKNEDHPNFKLLKCV